MATGRKTVVVGQVIDPVTWGNPLWDQSVQSFATAADRTAQFPAPLKGAVTWLDDPGILQVWDGAAWRTVGPVASASAVRDAQAVVNPAVWGDVGGVVAGFKLYAGVRYHAIGTGVVATGGATADISLRMTITPDAGVAPLQNPLAITGTAAQKFNVVDQVEWLQAVNATCSASFQATANAPATGLILYAGGSVQLSVVG